MKLSATSLEGDPSLQPLVLVILSPRKQEDPNIRNTRGQSGSFLVANFLCTFQPSHLSAPCQNSQSVSASYLQHLRTFGLARCLRRRGDSNLDCEISFMTVSPSLSRLEGLRMTACSIALLRQRDTACCDDRHFVSDCSVLSQAIMDVMFPFLTVLFPYRGVI